jgi:two-component sensor histidine kinase
MIELLNSVFAGGPFIPHGHCYLWVPELVWLHLGTDALIALAYYVMPLILISFVRKRPDLPFNWMFLMFGAFIIACGTTHVMSVWNVWYPTYWLSGGIKAGTAAVSLVTAGLLVPLVPKALALPSPAQLEALNGQLREQIREREQAEVALHQANDALEKRVQARTTALRDANEALRTEVLERRRAEEALRRAHDELELRIRDRTAELTRANTDLHAEVTQRQLTEAQLTTALHQKDVLFREVHHRVKNNLQIISSLLSLQSRYISDPQMLQTFNDTRNRIRAMALIHGVLDQANDFARVDFARYLQQLTTHLYHSYGMNTKAIAMHTHARDIWLNTEVAGACGLIVHELVSNALKHGFPEGRAGVIQVSMEHKHSQYMLTVTDNGVGLPAECNLHTTHSLGFKLVLALANQLSGHLECESHGGTRFRITFADASVGESSVASHARVKDQLTPTSPGRTGDGDV